MVSNSTLGVGGLIERVAQELRESILANELPPGTRLSQAELAQHFGVSRIPVRDALRALASEELVDLADRGAAVVTQLSVSDLQELYELREAVEPLASRLATPNVGRAELLRMEECLHRMERVDDAPAWLSANAEFHAQVYEQSRRPRMIRMIATLRNQTDRYMRVHLADLGETDHLLDEHRLIYEAAGRRDPGAVERLTLHHLATSHDFILRYLLEQSADRETQP